MICVTNPPSNQATEVEPEGIEVEERWMCEEGGLEAYATSDGRIICHEPEQNSDGFAVEDRNECFDIGG